MPTKELLVFWLLCLVKMATSYEYILEQKRHNVVVKNRLTSRRFTRDIDFSQNTTIKRKSWSNHHRKTKTLIGTLKSQPENELGGGHRITQLIGWRYSRGTGRSPPRLLSGKGAKPPTAICWNDASTLKMLNPVRNSTFTSARKFAWFIASYNYFLCFMFSP